MNGLAAIWQGLDWSFITDTLLTMIPALFCIVIHETSHGLMALWLGDTTARDEGRLTINPLKHLDIWGLVMMVFCGFGWAKAVPVNMYRFKNPKRGMAITALAGPVSNVLLAGIVLAAFGRLFAVLPDTRWSSYLLFMLQRTAMLSCSLAVFNLIPIPPLDGSKVLFSLVDQRRYSWLMRYERYGFIILILLTTTGASSGFVGKVTSWLYNGLFFIAEYTYGLVI